MGATAKNTLKKAGFAPLKRLGQNFLRDKNAVKRVVLAGKIGPGDIILEIGPGTGILTLELAKRAKKVVAVEKDRRMQAVLKDALKGFDNVEILDQDARRMPEIAARTYKVVANLPFYLASPVIRKFLESKNQPKQMTLIVQKEVAQRICAKVPDMNLLAVSVQFYAEPEIISFISKKAFWPQPEVDAAIINIVPRKKRFPVDPSNFFSVAKTGFSQPRKQLLNNLSKKLGIGKERVKVWLAKSNIQASQRAETLAIEDWINLAKTL
jgi:16S rRNA (adenine1518-N6/adenine1519-N6)-dimethyltransferase